MANAPIKPLSKGGKVTQHKGKGSEQAPMLDRGQMSKLPQGPFNNYGKMPPMPGPALPPMGGPKGPF